MINSTGVAGCRTLHVNERRIMEHCEAEMEVGRECRLHRLISVFSSRESPSPFDSALGHLKSVIPKGVSASVSAHAVEWESRWHAADIEVSHKHLDYYLDEFTFRFNRRRSKSRGKLFFRLVQQAVAVEPVPLDRIIHPGTKAKTKPQPVGAT